jgi:hypothetical protein
MFIIFSNKNWLTKTAFYAELVMHNYLEIYTCPQDYTLHQWYFCGRFHRLLVSGNLHLSSRLHSAPMILLWTIPPSASSGWLKAKSRFDGRLLFRISAWFFDRTSKKGYIFSIIAKRFNHQILKCWNNQRYALITLSILWGSSFLAIKVAIEIIPPLLSFGIRFAVSGTVLLGAYYLSHRGQNHHEHIGKHEWKDVLILGV